MQRTHVIRSVSFEADGTVQIEYATLPDDVRNNGLLIGSHAISVAPHEEYRDELEALADAAQRLLRDVLEDFASTPAWEPPPPADYDEGED